MQLINWRISSTVPVKARLATDSSFQVYTYGSMQPERYATAQVVCYVA